MVRNLLKIYPLLEDTVDEISLNNQSVARWLKRLPRSR